MSEWSCVEWGLGGQLRLFFLVYFWTCPTLGTRIGVPALRTQTSLFTKRLQLLEDFVPQTQASTGASLQDPTGGLLSPEPLKALSFQIPNFPQHQRV